MATNSPRGGLQPFLQRAGFEALAIVAVMIFDRESQRAIALDQRLGKWSGVVGGIVQHLDLQQLAGILDAGHFVDEPLDDVPFVIDGKLYGHLRQLREAPGGSPVAFLRCLKYVRMIS